MVKQLYLGAGFRENFPIGSGVCGIREMVDGKDKDRIWIFW